MNGLESLQRKLNEAKHFLAQDTETLAADPNNLSARLSKASWERFVSETEHQVHLLQKERDKEVVELRLRGALVDRGSVPLNVLGELCSTMYNILGKAAYRLRHGGESLRGIPEEISSELDLKLSGLSYGSSRLFFSANVTPDLTGESLSQDTIKELFDTLNSDTTQGFHEHLQRLGTKSSNSLTDFLKALYKHNISADLSWHTPSDSVLSWRAGVNTIKQKIDELEVVGLSSSVNQIVRAEVDLLSRGGKVHIKDIATGNVLRCSYPMSSREFVNNLTLGEIKTFVVMEETYKNSMTDAENTVYTLMGEQTEASSVND